MCRFRSSESARLHSSSLSRYRRADHESHQEVQGSSPDASRRARDLTRVERQIDPGKFLFATAAHPRRRVSLMCERDGDGAGRDGRFERGRNCSMPNLAARQTTYQPAGLPLKGRSTLFRAQVHGEYKNYNDWDKSFDEREFIVYLKRPDLVLVPSLADLHTSWLLCSLYLRRCSHPSFRERTNPMVCAH
jgi:hypothetical protein